MSHNSIDRVAHRGASAQYPENKLTTNGQRDDLQQIMMLGVHGIMTNRPDMLNKVLHDSTL
jgi:glycerophosphoryl diester phosphodiesterase